jgi:hypothetical protein
MNETLYRRMVDEAIERYVDWREACAGVSAAYVRFSKASAPDRSLSFAAYNAALDREASAAMWYRGVLARIELV